MIEWNRAVPVDFFDRMLANEYDVDSLLMDRSREATVAITDDRAVNEFYLLRRLR